LSDPADSRPWQPPSLSGRAVKREEPAGPDPDALRREAFEAGYAEGVAAGRARGEAMVAELSALWQAMARPLAEQEETLLRDLTGIALDAAEAILRRELVRGADVEAVLSEALAQLGDIEGLLEVELHPADVELVNDLLGRRGEPAQWRLKENASLARGGLRLHTPVSYIDASLEQALEELFARLRREAEHGLQEPS
jgi:flagellar assembly protein FliH